MHPFYANSKHAVFRFILFGINRINLIFKGFDGFTTKCGGLKISK